MLSCVIYDLRVRITGNQNPSVVKKCISAAVISDIQEIIHYRLNLLADIDKTLHINLQTSFDNST